MVGVDGRAALKPLDGLDNGGAPSDQRVTARCSEDSGGEKSGDESETHEMRLEAGEGDQGSEVQTDLFAVVFFIGFGEVRDKNCLGKCMTPYDGEGERTVILSVQ